MSKRLLVVAGIVMAVPVLGFSLLRLQRAAPAQAQKQESRRTALPEAIADLQQRIDGGEAKLDYQEEQGYLLSLLRALQIPVSSQTLVFGKNSAQLFLISPETPRALYFSDDVYIGYVQGAPHLEIASVDPVAGPVFYTLDQVQIDRPKFKLEPVDCLACHDTFESDRPVPRLLMLSTLADAKGVALNRSAIVTNDQSPFNERWGGWYVTGTHGKQLHMGNRFVREPASALGAIREYSRRADLSGGANVTDLSGRIDLKPYPSPASDIAALMVLGHQTHIHNLITVVAYNLRANPKESDIKEETEKLVETMLFSGAVPLTEPVSGATNFAAEFSAQGPRDSRGRSLHQLDLKQRLLRYPLSYLVYSKSFNALPPHVKDHIYTRFWEVLSGKDQSAAFAHLSAADRQAILEILKETKPDFAAFAAKLG